MSQFFEVDPVRKVSANGVLETVGLEWTEESSWRHSNKLLLLITIVPLSIAGLFFGLLLIASMGWAILLMTAGFSYAAWQYAFGRLPRRSVVFDRKGRVLVPFGLPQEKAARSLRLKQPDIVGFEIGPSFSGMQNDWTSTVKAVSRSGSTVTLSRFLHREEAREIVVGLNMALMEMRASVGEEPMQSYVPRAAHFSYE